MDKMGCPVVWWNIWYFLFGLLNCHGRCSEISWVLASGWQEQPGDHQCRGWIFWSWGSFPIRGHVNGKIIDLNVVMFDCQRVFVFGMHGLSHQIWWFRVNLSLHQSDKQWRYTGVCVSTWKMRACRLRLYILNMSSTNKVEGYSQQRTGDIQQTWQGQHELGRAKQSRK